MVCAKKPENPFIFEVKVIPRANKEKIEFNCGIIRVWVKEPPEKDKANRKVLALLTNRFGECEIVSGGKCRKKRIRFKKPVSPGL
ncbi:MAG: DUF167 domain-containing protein [Candidatus Altiarchaeota archaeon]|nr:DUF167 domain-containing protein [Candidatus Altiarchaeota archaeon]